MINFSNFFKILTGFFLYNFFSFPINAFGWSWQLEVVNNLDVPLNYTFNQYNSGNAHSEDGSKNVGSVQPNSSMRFALTTGGTFNKTTDGVLTLSNENNLVCHLRYYQESKYSAHNLSEWRLDGNDNSPDCQDLFISSTEASDDGWDPFDLIFNSVKFPRLTKGQEQCSGIDNCVVVNPRGYTTKWAVENLNRQAHMADNESLNVGQLFGTHNSVISRKYTNTNVMTNMSYSDPNHYLTITEQLDLGIRQFEYDILSKENVYRICHYKADDSALSSIAKAFVCDGNYTLQSTLDELSAWLSNNPRELIYLYFDNTEPWDASHVQQFEQVLNNALKDKILRKSDIKNTSLDVAHLTPNNIKQLGRNLIIYVHNPDATLISSDYIFHNVVGSETAPLHDDHSIAEFSEMKTACSYDISCVNKRVFSNDPNFLSLHVVREDRTHLEQQKGSHQNTSIYLTHEKLKDGLRYPVNIFDFDKLSKDDSRLYQAVWSFVFPYPLASEASGLNLAFIDPATKKFSNQNFDNDNYDVLCYQKNTHQWIALHQNFEDAVNLLNDPDLLIQQAENLCKEQSSDSVFATPVNSYQLNLILQSGALHNKTFINYKRDKSGDWISNSYATIGYSAI